MTIVLMRKQMLGQGWVTYDKPPDLDQVQIRKNSLRQSIQTICPTSSITCQSSPAPPPITTPCFFLVWSSLVLITRYYKHSTEAGIVQAELHKLSFLQTKWEN